MDDYESSMKHSSRFYDRTLKRFILRKDLDFLFGAAKLNLAISKPMSRAFHQRYGHTFETFHNEIDPAQWISDSASTSPGNPEVDNGKRFRIVMAGSIDERKDASVISQVSRAVHDLNESDALECELILNVSSHLVSAAKKLADIHQGVTAQEYQSQDEYRKLLSTADCLLLARNSDKLTRAYTGLSFHNKLPEYLVSGTLILCIGLNWDGSVRFLTEHKCCVVMSDATDPDIRKKILVMATNSEQIFEFKINARKSAIENSDIKQIRKRFRQSLCDATISMAK